MPRQLSPGNAAARLEKWARAGFDIAVVDGLTATLEADKTASAGRAPRASGRLAATVKIVRPSASSAARKGFIIGRLKAGNRKRADQGGVPYARVHQVGGIFVSPTANASHTNRHGIAPKSADGRLRFVIGGKVVFARRVAHPGSRFKKLEYLRIDEDRAQRRIDTSLQRSADKEIG